MRNCAGPDMDAIAVTQGPGLVGSLLVGVAFAKAAAATLDKPVVAVHHLAGHIESMFLEHGAVPLPAVVLVVSGGHTSLYLVTEPGQLPAGRPDARRCGRRGVRQGRQAAGPRVSRRSRDRQARARGPRRCRRRCRGRSSRTRSERASAGAGSAARPQGQPLAEFSFSGLKTAVVRAPAGARRRRSRRDWTVPTDAGPLSRQEVADFCASFQRVVVETLVDRTFDAARQLGARSVGIAGGVSANSRLRRDAARGRARRDARVHSARSRCPPTMPR